MNLIQSFNHAASESSCFIDTRNGEMEYQRKFIEAKFSKPNNYSSLESQFEQFKDKLQHPNIVNYHQIKKENGSTIMTRKYINGENFNFYIALGNLSPDDLIQSAKKITEIVKFVHSKGIIIKNLIPSNIIINITGAIHLVDIGYDAIYVDTFSSKDSVHLLFSSPELVKNDSTPSFEKDIWCLGVILYMIVTGRYPYPIKNSIKLMQLIMKGDFEIPSGIDDKIADLLKQMLSPDPKKRPTANEVYETISKLDHFGKHQRAKNEIILSNPDLPTLTTAAQNNFRAKQGMGANQAPKKP